MAYEPGASHPVRPRRTARAAMLLAGIALLLCCVGATGFGAWNLQAVRRAAEPARRTAEAFLGDVTVGDASAAYDRLCADTRDRWQRLEFVRWLEARPPVSQYTVDDVSVATHDGLMRATVATRLTHDSGTVVAHNLVVLREEGHWRVCGDPF
jgi:hypothetical protein